MCLQNLRKTLRYGGRKNVPSVEEVTAVSAGRNSKRQLYRLPGGSETVVNTKSTTVVADVISGMCSLINVNDPLEMEEFSLYCIVEGDAFTMPLAADEYILDVTTELHKNQQVFYLIFCRSVWYFPLRLDSQLYVQVLFNQIAPDYLEGLLLVLPFGQLPQELLVRLRPWYFLSVSYTITVYLFLVFVTVRSVQVSCFTAQSGRHASTAYIERNKISFT